MVSMIILNLFLTTAQYGELVYSSTLCSFYLMFVVFGIDILGSRFIHESENPINVYCEITIFKGINFVIGLIPFIGILYALDTLQDTILFLPMVVSEVFGLAVYFLGLNSAVSLFNYRLASKGIGVMSLILFLVVGLGPLSYPMSLFCTMILDIVLFTYVIRGASNIMYDRKKYCHYLRESWPLAGSSMLVLGVSGGARLYVGSVFGSATLGLFDIFERVIRGFKVVQVVYNKYLVTVITDSYRDMKKYLRISLLINISLILPLYLIFYQILPLFLKPKDFSEVMQFVHLIPTVLWVGLSQYMSFLLAIIRRKSMYQLVSLLAGFGVFYMCIWFIDFRSVDTMIYFINFQEITVLFFLSVVIGFEYRKRYDLKNLNTKLNQGDGKL